MDSRPKTEKKVGWAGWYSIVKNNTYCGLVYTAVKGRIRATTDNGVITYVRARSRDEALYAAEDMIDTHKANEVGR